MLKEMLLVSTLSDEGIRAYHHGDLRKALLDAASALLGEVGVAAISLREVARRAGVSHNAPYRHFADRDALLAAIALEGFAALVHRIEALPVAELSQRGECYVAYALEFPGHFALMFGPQLDKRAYPELQQVAQRLFAQLEASVAALCPDEPAQTASLAAWSLVHGLSQLLLNGQYPDEDAAATARTVTGLFVEGLLARRSPA
jgi:AcrR family transcriptional regulator